MMSSCLIMIQTSWARRLFDAKRSHLSIDPGAVSHAASRDRTPWIDPAVKLALAS